MGPCTASEEYMLMNKKIQIMNKAITMLFETEDLEWPTNKQELMEQKPSHFYLP